MFTNLFLKLLNKEASQPRQKAGEIIDCLQIKPGTFIADIGSGGGYFTVAFAERVGQKGKVYAVDTHQKKLQFIKKQAAGRGLDNIVLILAAGDELQLPQAGLDLIFVRNAFHHLTEPLAYFTRLRRFIKPDGRVAIIDHKATKGFGHVALFKHYTAEEDVLRTMEKAGYALEKSFDFLPAQSFNIFTLL